MPKTSDAPTEFLPLTAAVLHILLALGDGDRHGYAIAQEVEELTAGSVHMGPGTLYGSLQRMMSSGFVERAPRRAHAVAGEERRVYYRLSALGRRVLQLELQRLDSVVAIARRRHLLREPRSV
jgi:DNA-binding PadR family transcriptional regulator